MWKRGGRSSALDRAQGLLAAKRSSGAAGKAGTQGHVQGSVRESVNSRPAVPSFSDLSEESSVSLAAELRPFMAGKAGETCGAEADVRPQTSLGGQSRFLKKPPPPTSSSQSPALPEPRCVPSSQRSSQTAVLSRLALIESRVRIRKQAQDQAQLGTKPANNLTSDISPAAAEAAQSPVAPEQPSDHRLKGKCFLKSRATGAAGAAASDSADVGVRFRAAEPAVPSAHVRRKPMKLMSSVSLESDEEDMKRLLGDALDSSDDGFSRLGRSSSIRKQDKISSKRVSSTLPRSPARPPHAAASPPPSSPSSAASPRRHPDSPSHRRASPFRFTGQAQARFSPSVPSPPPSSSPAERPGSSGSLTSASGRDEVLSLEELFPAGPHSEEPGSDASSVSSGDFMINVKSLDELVPATFGLAAETPGNEARSDGNERETKQTITASTEGQQQLHRGEEEEEEEEEEDYQSDFESESRSDQSASQVSEDVQEEVSEVRSEGSDSSCGKTVDGYSSAVSDGSRTVDGYSSAISGGSRTALSGVQDSESWTSSSSSRSRAERPRRPLKEAAVQTHPEPLTHTWWSGAAAPPYLDFTPVLTHTLRAERVEALSTFSPALSALSEMLKQQLVMMTHSIQNSQQQHSRLLQSLEPPNYRYTTLEDTLRLMKKRRSPKLSMEEALEEALQEMRDCHCT